MGRRLLKGAAAVVALVAALFVGNAAASAATVSQVAAATCAGTVQINSLSFSPATISPGQSSTVTMVAQNCTSQALNLTSYWYGKFSTPTSTGIPAGCPAIDPLPRGLSFPASGTITVSQGWSTFSGCTATTLTITININVPGGTVVSKSAVLNIVQVTPTCKVAYVKQSEWAGGFVAGVTISTSTPTPTSGWTLVFTFPGDQKITNAWNAVVTQNGAIVTAKNVPNGPVISPNASYNFGFQGTWHTSDAAPTSFTLNGLPCATA